MPPIEFDALVEGLVPEGSRLRRVIGELLARKKAGDEMDYEPRIHSIDEYLEEKIAYFSDAVSRIPAAVRNQDQKLDQLFRSALREVWQTNGL